VARAEELHATLLQALQAADEEVTLSFSDVQGVDLSFFQLLHAATRSFQAGGKRLVLGSDLPGELHRAAACTGLHGIAAAQAPAQEAGR